MTGGLYVNANWRMSSNQHISQTKIGLLGKITGARVMVCFFDPSENMNWYVQVVYIKIHTLYIEIDLYFQWDPRDKP